MDSTLSPPVYRSTRPRPDVVPLPNSILGLARAEPEAVALIDGATGETLTRADLARHSAALAAGLRARGIGAGDLVAIAMPNLASWPVVALGIWRAGAAISPLSPLWTADELARVIARAAPRLVIAFGPLATTVRAALDEAAPDCELVVLGGRPDGEQQSGGQSGGGQPDGATAFDALLADPGDDPFAPPVLADAQLAAVPFSSGTSGLPKGVRLSHANLAAAAAHGRDCLSQEGGELDEHAVALAAAPFFHSIGLTLMMNGPLSVGARIVTMPRPELESLLALVAEHRATHTAVPPPLAEALAYDPRVEGHDLSSLVMVASGGAHVPPAVQLDASERLGCVVRQGYGMTETTCVIAAPLGRPGALHAVGWLAGGTEARLVDPDSGRDVHVGEPGELWVRGPQVMQGYNELPDETNAIITSDGWLRTGDLAAIAANGQVQIHDRLKELIKVGGASVAPAELELVLRQHPAVRDAAVVRSPDPRTGERPVALVALASAVDPDELAAFVADRVAGYKRLREVIVVDEIPRLATGKLLKRALPPLPA